MNESESLPGKADQNINNQNPSFVELFFSFKGRINRAKYWLYDVVILTIMLYIPTIFIGTAIRESVGLIVGFGIGFLIIVWPHLALNIKRCHDRNRSGLFFLISIIPLLNIWYVIEVSFLKGTAGNNAYGSDPLDIEEKEKTVTDKSLKGRPLTVSIIMIVLLIFLSYGVIRLYYDVYIPNYSDRLRVEMEMDSSELFYRIADNKDVRLERILTLAEKEAKVTGTNFISAFIQKMEESRIDPSSYYSVANHSERGELIHFFQQKTQTARTRTREVLYKRLKAYGCIGIKVEESGPDRIVAEVAVHGEMASVRKIIGSTALLEFRLLKDHQVIDNIGNRINDYFKGKAGEDVGRLTSEEENISGNNSIARLEELFGEDTSRIDSELLERDMLFKENLFLSNPNNPNFLLVPKENESKLRYALQDSGVQRILSEEVGNAELLMGKTESNFPYIPVYLANKQAELTGETIEGAQQQVGGRATSIGGYEVFLNFNDEGARIFGRVTGANLQKPLAIVLDGIVQSAPIIQTKIRDGRAVITGLNSMDEARDLAIVLKAGALPAPLNIVEERIIKSKAE